MSRLVAGDEADDVDAEDVRQLRDLASEAPVIRLVNLIVARAIEARASDIHIEPFENRLAVRYRIDGVLRDAEAPPVRSTAAVVSRIKVLANLDISERRLPQDGRIKLRVGGREIDVRISTVPELPNLGITIVPLVYGDHHSWNLAYLAGEQRNVPTHRHADGVEIHLGYRPTHGQTVLGNYRAQVDAGYAMPIPPGTDHGWVNNTDQVHHVPFIFGSLKHGGWGVFLDVTPATKPVERREQIDRYDGPFSQMIDLEHAIDQAARMAGQYRTTLIPFTVTHRGASGGLELNLTRVAATYTYPTDAFRIVSISRGTGAVSIDGIEAGVKQHDHFGVPAGAVCAIRQTGDQPLVALDAMIKGY